MTEVIPELRPLHEKAVTRWRLGMLGRGAFFVAAVIAFEIFGDIPLPTGLLGSITAAITVVLAVVVPPIRYRAWGFALRDRDVYLRHGVIFRTTSIVPHARIQHVDTRNGPIDRWLGLATVVMYTAGTQGAIIGIPGLAAPEAEAIRDTLAARSGVGDAV